MSANFKFELTNFNFELAISAVLNMATNALFLN